VRSVSSRALGNRVCAAAPLSTLSSSPALRPQTAPFQTAPLQTARLETTATTRALELITDCDAECSQELGASGANDKIAEYINDVNTIYPEELGITVVLIKQVRRTSSSTYPASLTDSLSLLERFRTVGAALGNADAKHLITGKSLDSDVLGLAYVEATCSTPEFTAYGLSTRSSDLLTPIIIAHEIGHNLGASHDTVTGGIMSPRLGSPPPSSFSTFSRNEIAAYLQQFSPSCLEEKLPETSFTVSYKRRKLVASLSLPEGYAGCTVSFKAGITKSRQKTLLLQQVLEEGETNIPLLITNLSRVNPSGSSDIQVFLLPSATCTTGGDLSGPLRALTVSSTRSLPSGLGAAKGWMRALRNRLQE